MVGSVCPTFSVPGMIRSGTILKNRNSAVVVAKDPMPSVSRKLVMAPTPVDSGVGAPASVAGEEAAPGSPRRDMTIFAQPATNTAVNAPSAVSNPVMGFIARSLQQVKVGGLEVGGWRLKVEG